MLGPSDHVSAKLPCLVKSSPFLTHPSTSHPGTFRSAEGILNILMSMLYPKGNQQEDLGVESRPPIFLEPLEGPGLRNNRQC